MVEFLHSCVAVHARVTWGTLLFLGDEIAKLSFVWAWRPSSILVVLMVVRAFPGVVIIFRTITQLRLECLKIQSNYQLSFSMQPPVFLIFDDVAFWLIFFLVVWIITLCLVVRLTLLLLLYLWKILRFYLRELLLWTWLFLMLNLVFLNSL